MADLTTFFHRIDAAAIASAKTPRDLFCCASSEVVDGGSSIAPSESASHRAHYTSPSHLTASSHFASDKHMQNCPEGQLHQDTRALVESHPRSTHGLQPSSNSSTSTSGNFEDTPTGLQASDRTSDTSLLLQTPRHSNHSLISFDSNLSSVGAYTPPERCTDGLSVRRSSASINRLTERPRKHQPLFQYIDWNGHPSKAPVRRAPPVSFNRWIQDESTGPVAMTSIVLDAKFSKSSGHGETGGRSSYKDWQLNGADGSQAASDGRQTTSMPASKTQSGSGLKTIKDSGEQTERQGHDSLHPTASAMRSNPSTPPRSPTPPPPHFYNFPGARVSGHNRQISDSTDGSIPSISTSQLPNVTNPGMRAHYAQYLAASSRTSSSAAHSTNEQPTPSPRRAEFLAKHDNTRLAIFPPDVNKPLPPIHTPYGAAVPAQYWGVESLKQLESTAFEIERLHTNTVHLESMLLLAMSSINSISWPKSCAQPGSEALPGTSYASEVDSYFSDSESEDDGTDIKVREIDPKMFGRAKYKHMRPGCTGWAEYREQMLEESKGKRRRPAAKMRMIKETWIGRHVRKLSSSHP